MKTYQNMTNSERLTMLLDGELSGEQETEIYSALATDPDLQAQLEHQIAIKEAVRNDTEAFTPPLEATFNIFNELGYAVPAGIPAVKTIWDRIFNRRVAVTAALLLFSSLTVTSIIMNKSDDVAAKSKIAKSSDIIADNSDLINAEPDDANALTQIADNNTKSKIIPISNSIDATESTSNRVDFIPKSTEDKQEVKEEIVNLATSTLPSEFNGFHNFAFMNNAKFEYMRSRKSEIKYNSVFNLFDKDHNSLYFRAGINSNNAAINGINNFMIGYMRNWKNNFSFGVELGTESINRLFTDDFSNSLTLEAKQVVWGAFALRYESHDLSFAGFSPFAQARIGIGSDFNYMFGGNMGIIRNFHSIPFSISAAFEYSNFQYTHLSNSYIFDKSGFVFGIHYNF